MKVCMFPGQGSQTLGMGKDLFDKYPKFVNMADDIFGFSVKELCCGQDSNIRLHSTEFVQPALFIVNALSYLDYINEHEFPDYLIGHGLGEYNALLAAGVIEYEDSLKLVKRRGELMGKVKNGSMALIVGMNVTDLQWTLQESGLDELDIANINNYKQVIISGPSEKISESKDIFEKKEAEFFLLDASGPFHSRYMKEMADEYEYILKNIPYKPFRKTVISNYTAKEYTEDQISDLLLNQICNPVRWTESIEYLLNQKVDEFVQVGPGNTLERLCKEIIDSQNNNPVC